MPVNFLVIEIISAPIAKGDTKEIFSTQFSLITYVSDD